MTKALTFHFSHRSLPVHLRTDQDWFENDQLGSASCSPPSRLLPASTSAWLPYDPYVSSSSLVTTNLGSAGWCHSALLFICIWSVFL